MAAARPQTPPARGGDGSKSARIASPNLLDNLLTTADADEDAAAAPNLADLSLTELVAPGQAQASKQARQGRPSLKSGGRGARPSWGPAPAGATQIRLLQGLSEDPLQENSTGDKSGSTSTGNGSGVGGASGAGRLPPSTAAGGRAKPRFSLFTRKSLAPSQLQRGPLVSADIDEPKALSRLSEGEPLVQLADEIPALSAEAPVAAAAAAPAASPSVADAASEAETSQDYGSLDADALRASAAREREDALKRNLLEVRRMNEVFEGYEAMLLGSAEQIDQFHSRVRITDTLLDSYIALLRDASRTQELLLSSEWKGASADSAEAHALAVALAERETERVRALEEQRRREAEIERRRREAERAEQERAREEEERRAALVASAGAPRAGLRASTAAGRGGGANSAAAALAAARGRGGPAAARAAAAAAAGTARMGARPPVAGHTRGASTSTRGGAGSSRIGRASSIPRPPSAGGA